MTKLFEYSSKPTFVSSKIYHENLEAVHKNHKIYHENLEAVHKIKESFTFLIKWKIICEITYFDFYFNCN